jgi:hypothetical protein
MAVIGFQLHITVDLDFEAIADELVNKDEDVKTVDEIREMWNQGELEEFLGEHFESHELVQMAEPDGCSHYPIQVGSGYMSH